MKCSNCSKIITSCRDCIFCGRKCCCFICLESHYLSSHKNKSNPSKSKDKNNQILKREKEKELEKNKISPYLISGIINKKINYNSKYNLENFTPIMDKDKNEIKTIGSGSFGQVYLALNTIDNKIYAIKHMDKKKLIKILHTLNGIYQEIDIQSRINHPNIVKILYTDEDRDSFDLVMEYADNGSLFHFIRKNKGLNEYKTFQLFIQVVNAINFLHENDLIHRDIKPENILLFSNNNKKSRNDCDYIVKLCDFGWCVKLNGGERDTFCGTTEYMSPELVDHKEYSKEIDVWSLGILLYEMIHGYSPFRPNKPKFNEKDVFENIKKHNLKFGKKVSNECKKLICNLLAFNKNKRYKVGDIYNSKFVKYFENMKYFIPKKNSINKNNKDKKENEENNNEEDEVVYINQIHEIKTNNNNNFIHREVNDDVNNNGEKINNNIDKNPINKVYEELKQLKTNNLRKVLTNHSVENKIIKSFSKKNNNKERFYTGIRNKYNLNLIENRKDKNHSISYVNNNKNNVYQTLNKKRITNRSEEELMENDTKRKNLSLQKDFKRNYETPNILNDKNLRKNRTISKNHGHSLYKDSNKQILNTNIENIQNYHSFIEKNNISNNFVKKNNNNKNMINFYSISMNNKEKINKNKIGQILINKSGKNSKKKKYINKQNFLINKEFKCNNNNLHPIEIYGKIPMNTEKMTQKRNDISNNNKLLKNNLSYKNVSQRLKTNINISSTSNSISKKIKKENNIKEKNKNNNLIKIKTINKEIKMDKNKINKNKNINELSELKSAKENNSKMGLTKINSICNIKKIYSSTKESNLYNYSTSNINEASNNENINHDNIKLELSPESLIHQKIKKKEENLKIKPEKNNNYEKSPNLQNKKNSLKINNKNKIKNISNNKKVSSISPKHLKNINSYRNRNISKNFSKSRSSKMETRKINSMNNKNNRLKEKPKIFFSNKSKEKILNNKNESIYMNINLSNKKNININGLNKNLFNSQENEIYRIQSDRILFTQRESNNKSTKKNILTPPNGNYIFIKSKKDDNNQNNKKLKNQIKNISPNKYLNLLRNNTTQNKTNISNSGNNPQNKKLTKIKLQNKKSFCFISRNNKLSQNKYENIFCGPINKINNINYQSNNINNFYIINSNNINNTGTNLNQKILKKQFTEHQRELKKNIEYSKFMLPITLIENGSVNHTFNNSKKIKSNKELSQTKSSNKKKEKLNLKYYLMKLKNKRVNSYNNKRFLKNKEKSKSKSKESESDIIYGDSDFSDEGERNVTPKKNKDNVKINPIKLLGDFKKEYKVFYMHNKNLSEYSGFKI